MNEIRERHRSRSGVYGWVGDEEIRDTVFIRATLAKAEAGNEDALACLRDSYGLRRWVRRGKILIDGGVLCGVRDGR